MKESEERSSNIDEQKARIRQRYKGIDPEELEVIPALPPEDIFKTEKKLRVAVYARVSTDDPRLQIPAHLTTHSAKSRSVFPDITERVSASADQQVFNVL